MTTSIKHIDPKEWENKSREEIQAEISRLIDFKNTRKSEESAIKTFINAVYGAFGSPYFNMYSTDIAEAITLQGQHIIKTADQAINDYFHNVWHTDTEAHQQLGITGPVKKIPDEKDLVIYVDTDSITSDSIINTNKYGNISIGELLDLEKKNAYRIDILDNGACHVYTSGLKVLNWDDATGLYYADVKMLFCHSVRKKKWKLKSKSGKEIICTEDHSLVVFRDGNKIVVKPDEIKPGDKLLVVK